MTDYTKFRPKKGYLIVKDITKEQSKGPMKYSGESESRAYGRVVVSWDQFIDKGGFEKEENKSQWLGKLVVFNEFAGQELEKFKGITDEDNLLVMSEDEIVCTIIEE